MKNKFILILVCFIALSIFCVTRDILLKNVITVVAGNVTGAPTHIGWMSLSIMRQSVKISDFKMYSPKGFPPDAMVDMPLMRVSWDIFSIARGKLHLRELELDLKEVVLVKNKDGALNVESLKIAGPGQKGQRPSRQMSMQMDLVQLNIGRVVSKDYSVSGAPAIKVYEIGVKKTYKNINSAQQLSALILAEPLKAAGIQGLSVYGASALTGVAALPVAAAFTLAGKDYEQAEYSASWDKAYEAGLAALKESGRIMGEDRASGVISAEVGGARVALKVRRLSGQKTQITVSARKYMLPRPEVASGIMYRISDKLK